LYDNNICLVLDLRSAAKGKEASKILRTLLNIPQSPTRFGISCQAVSSAVADVSESSLLQPAREAVAENYYSYI
jgi:hypothetical protein